MCELKSGLVLKDSIYVPEHDHHTNMLEELGIEDTEANATSKFVRFELLPPCDDVFAPVEQWTLNVDQDMLPDWFFEEVELPKIQAAVKAWADKHVFVDKHNFSINGGGTYYLKDCLDVTVGDNCTSKHFGNCTSKHFGNCTSKHFGNCTSEHHGNCTSEHHGNCTSKHFGNCTSEHHGNCTSEHHGNCTSEHHGNCTSEHHSNCTSEHFGNCTSEHFGNCTSKHHGNCTSEHHDNCTSEHFGNCTSKHHGNCTSEHHDNCTAIIGAYAWCKSPTRDNFVLMDNSTLKDCKAKIIYQSGDWKFVAAQEGGK